MSYGQLCSPQSWPIRNDLRSATVQQPPCTPVLQHTSRAKRLQPKTPACTLPDGGQTRVGRHIGRCEKKRAVGDGENGCAAILALAMEAREPCCDLARSGSHPHVDNTSPELASHPSVPYVRWCRYHLHDGISRLASTNTCSQSLKTQGWVTIIACDRGVGDDWVALPDHADAICPTRPMGSHSGLHGTCQPQSLHGQWEMQDLR